MAMRILTRRLGRLCNQFFSSPINVFLCFLVFMYVANPREWLITDRRHAETPRNNNHGGDTPRRHGYDDVNDVPNKDKTNLHQGEPGSLEQYDSALTQLKGIDITKDEFLQSYERQCEFMEDPDDQGLPLCTCVPKKLCHHVCGIAWIPCLHTLKDAEEIGRVILEHILWYGKLPVPLESPSWSRVLASQSDLLPGGEWKPRDCLARQRVALIIPYRDRESHLRMLLYHTLNIFKRHLQHFKVFLVEQIPGGPFNKALLMNAAFLEAQKLWNFDCVIFHDVDMLLEDDRAIYACADSPRHLGAFVDKFRYKLAYPELFGGAVAMRPELFLAVNGYANSYFGWGGEDDDMYFRLLAKGFSVERYPAQIARFQMIPHATDRGNPVNSGRMRSVDDMTSSSASDGLKSIVYIVNNITQTPIYTHILVRPACPLREKPYMGSSSAPVIKSLTVDMESCRMSCSHSDECSAITWEMNTNLCSLHHELRAPTPKTESLYFLKDCSKMET